MATTTASHLTHDHAAPAPRQPASRPQEPLNVGNPERWLSAALGGALAVGGLARGGLGGWATAALGGALVYRGVSGHCGLYQSLGVTTARDDRAPFTSVRAGRGYKVEKTVTVNRSPEEVFRFWRNFENLPRFMSHLKSVTVQGNDRSHWVAKGPLGTEVEWDAEIYTERPNEMISWRSVGDSEVDTAGSVHFTRAPGDQGTEVRVVIKYDPPGGKLGANLAALFGESPEQQVQEDLRRFKQILETGSVARAK